MKNLPNYLSAVRIILSPIFLIVFMFPVWTDGSFATGSVVLCWLLMFLMDISDILDGYTARKFGIVSDFGKMFDPYTDLFARLTYFLCFVCIGHHIHAYDNDETRFCNGCTDGRKDKGMGLCLCRYKLSAGCKP